MTGMCIYENNRGLGACSGPVAKLKVTNKRSAAWKGLNDLAERLKEGGEEPGVCQVHEKRAGENGYVLDVAAPAPRKTVRRGRAKQAGAESPSQPVAVAG